MFEDVEEVSEQERGRYTTAMECEKKYKFMRQEWVRCDVELATQGTLVCTPVVVPACGGACLILTAPKLRFEVPGTTDLFHGS